MQCFMISNVTLGSDVFVATSYSTCIIHLNIIRSELAIKWIDFFRQRRVCDNITCFMSIFVYCAQIFDMN